LDKNATKAAVIAVVFLMASGVLMTMTVQAQENEPHGFNPQDNGSVPLPAGVTPDVSYDTISYVNFRPNPIGVGQPLLVNVWMQPPVHVSRYHTGYKVTFTKPDGTKDTVGPLSSFQGDTTAWFEYTVDQVGTWKIEFDFLGSFFPAGNYSVQAGTYAGGQVLNAPLSVYYKPSSDGPYEFVVQQDMVGSWPPSPLPTDYWTRPVSVENREWWSILGNYPATGIVAGIGRGATLSAWPADTNTYMSNYGFTPYVQGPKSAHIAWMRQGTISGLAGGTLGIASLTGGGGGPSIVYAGRCYQSLTKVFNGVTQSVWQCYDLRTGEVYWEKTNVTQVPTMILYSERETETVPGETASSGRTRGELMYVGGGRLITYNPWSGAVDFDISIAPLTTGTYYASYDWPYFLTVQSLSGKNYLINWTLAGDRSGFALSNFRLSVLSNVSWPFSNLGVVDYEAGVAVSTAGITPSSVGVAYGQRIMGASLTTGQLLWNVSTDTSTGLGGFFSGSTAVADHGKYAVRLNDGHWHCWDLHSGRELWTNELTSWPWGTFGCYGVQSYGGNIISNQYDGVVAYNWTTGKISWWYQDKAEFPYETPFGDNDPWFTGNAAIADGVIYTHNTEHSPSLPIMRGLRLHAINATDGTGIWNITGNAAPGAVADGYLTASDSYDGFMYVYGKGKSATTVIAPDVVMPKGNGIVIRGTVLDQSPAQPGTPCVSKDTMATQMEYLHMQHPVDGVDHQASISGVPVILTALDSNGAVIDLGTATTNGYYGTFSKAWTPPNEGTYQIIASFAGDDSYGSSAASTAVSVGPAVQTPETPAVPTPTDYTMAIVGAAIAIMIVVAIAVAVAVMILRKR
jgi:hypothetical protein